MESKHLEEKLNITFYHIISHNITVVLILKKKKVKFEKSRINLLVSYMILLYRERICQNAHKVYFMLGFFFSFQITYINIHRNYLFDKEDI